MNSPYMGDFKVTQEYKGAAHDGLDLVGLDSKEIHATVNGVVERAGWENAANKAQGFGLYVRIKQDGSDDSYYYGHMSSVAVKVGDRVKITDVIGVEGSTGNSTGSHCHYCVRTGAVKGKHKDISAISGIPNARGVYNDGYLESKKEEPAKPAESGTAFKKGDKVALVKAEYYDGGKVPDWVMGLTWVVSSVKGDRVVIDKSADGKHSIKSPVNAANLKRAGEPSAETAGPKSGTATLKAGDWNVRRGPSLGASVARTVRGPQPVTYVDIVSESDPNKHGTRNFYKLRDGNYLSVNACE